MHRSIALAAAMLVTSACSPQRQAPTFPPCGVEEQAIYAIPSILVVVLPEALGGLECTPGDGVECAERLEECVGSMSAQVDDVVATEVVLDNRSSVDIDVDEVTLEGACSAWSLAADFPRLVGRDSSAPISIALRPTSAGTCSATLRIKARAGNLLQPDGVAVHLVAEVAP